MQSLFQKVQSGEIQREDMQAGMQKNQQALKDGVAAILTDSQKAKFKELQGKEFKFDEDTNGGR
jgi:hypothetical protein